MITKIFVNTIIAKPKPKHLQLFQVIFGIFDRRLPLLIRILQDSVLVAGLFSKVGLEKKLFPIEALGEPAIVVPFYALPQAHAAPELAGTRETSLVNLLPESRYPSRIHTIVRALQSLEEYPYNYRMLVRDTLVLVLAENLFNLKSKLVDIALKKTKIIGNIKMLVKQLGIYPLCKLVPYAKILKSYYNLIEES